MNLLAPMCIYCERTSDQFWAEPLNAVSNAAFLVVAVVCGRQARSRRDGPAGVLALIVGAVGVGSFLFHTFANVLTSFGDIIPIGIFILGYLGAALRRLFSMAWSGVALALGAEVLATAAWMSLLPPAFLNGSSSYLAAWVSLPIISLALIATARPGGGGLFSAFLTFTMGLAFRILDKPVCSTFPIGTHFLWHLSDALTLLILLQTYMRAPGSRIRVEVSGPVAVV